MMNKRDDSLVGKLVFNVSKDDVLSAYFDKLHTQHEVGVIVKNNKNKNTTWGHHATLVIYWLDRIGGDKELQEYFSHHVGIYEPGGFEQLYVRDRLMIEWYHNDIVP